MAWHGITDGKDRVNVESNGSLPVTIQDATTPPFIIPMSKEVDNTTLSVDTAIDDYSLTIADTTNFVDGSFVIVLNSEGGRYWFGYQVGAPVGNVISVDRPFDFTYRIGDTVTSANTNLAVNGSVTPQTFRVRIGEPVEGIPVTIDIVRVIIVIYSATAVDLNSFGDLTALTKGCTFRKVNTTTQNIFNIKTNGEIANIAFDMNFYTAIGQGQDGVSARLTFGGQSKMGTVLRIGEQEDLHMIINDNLSGLDKFMVIVEGSLVTN